MTRIGRRSPVLLLVALVLVPAACGDDDEETAAEPAAGGAAVTADDLEGRSFEATEVTGHDLVDGSTVRFTFDDGSLSTTAGCNTMTGSFAIDDDRLVVGELAQTMMACPEDLTAQDDWLSGLVSSRPTIELDGDALVLSGDDGTIRATEDA